MSTGPCTIVAMLTPVGLDPGLCTGLCASVTMCVPVGQDPGLCTGLCTGVLHVYTSMNVIPGPHTGVTMFVYQWECECWSLYWCYHVYWCTPCVYQ